MMMKRDFFWTLLFFQDDFASDIEEEESESEIVSKIKMVIHFN